MAASDIRAGGAFVEFSLRKRKLERGLKSVAKRIRAVGAKISSIGVKFAAVGAAITAPFALAIRQFVQVGDQLDKMSKRTGISVETLSELKFAAEQSGSGIEVLEKGIRGMQRSVNDLGRGLSTQVDAFTDLGLTFKDLDGLSPEQQFLKIADQIAKIGDPGKRAAVAMQVFGRAGQQLVPLLSGGSEAINQLREEAKSLGLQISGRTAKDAARLADAWNIVKKQLLAVAINIGAKLAPVLEKVANIVGTFSVGIIEWVKNNGALIRTVALVGVGVLLLGGTLLGIGWAASLAGVAISGLAMIASALLSPVGLIVVALAGATVALFKFTSIGGQAVNFLKKNFGGLLGFVTETFGAIGEAIAAGDIKLAVEILWTSVKLLFVKGTAGLREKLFGFKADALKIWAEIKFGLLANLNETAANHLEAWIRISAGAQTMWQNISGDAKEAMNLAMNIVEKGAHAIHGFFDEAFNVETASKMADDAFGEAQRQAQEARKKNVDAIEADRALKLGRLEEVMSAREGEIAAQLDSSLKDLKDLENKESAALETQITKLQEQRKAALAKLKGLTPKDSSADQFDPDLSSIDALQNSLNNVAKNGAARGVINSGAIQALSSGGNSRLDKLIQKSADQIQQLKAIKRLLSAGDVVLV